MIRFVALRLMGGVLTLLLASALVFASTEVLPGDAAEISLGKEATPERVERLREALGLDRPAASRYWDWVSGVVQLDFGRSLTEGVGLTIAGSGQKAVGVPVGTLIEPRLGKSAILMAAAVAILIPLAFLIGTATALRRGSVFDSSAQVLMLVFVALPEFVLGAALALAFGVGWPILPPVSLEVSAKSLVLPVAALVLVAIAQTARMIRAGVSEVVQTEYVQLARMKGLPEWQVIRRHVLPNSLGATLQAFALVIGWLAGGVVIVEYLFSYPGVGDGLVRAISSRDFPTVQAYTVLIAGVYVAANLLADLLTVALNPRLRTSL